jgi:DNA-directed RNA polymerase specialized sigma subunit
MNGKISNEVIETYRSMVVQIASEYCRKYPMVERQDLEQHLWLWFIEHPVKTKEWLKEDIKDSDKLFARSLRNAAYDMCVREKAHKEGYSIEDVFWYRKEFVKAMIPAILSDNWQKVENALSTTGRSTKSLEQSDDWMAHVADIRRAFGMLDEKEQNLVFLFYGEEVTSQDLHEQALPEKPSSKAAAMQANRALNKMVRHLGGFPPFKDEDESSGNEAETEERIQQLRVDVQVGTTEEFDPSI